MMNHMEPWIGVDLDGTLAHYDGWQGHQHIGAPIPGMVERVRHWIKQGTKVKVFTARASVPSYIPYVRNWLDSLGLYVVEITNVKDFAMIELWDDQCIQVIPNTGDPVQAPVREGTQAKSPSSLMEEKRTGKPEAGFLRRLMGRASKTRE